MAGVLYDFLPATPNRYANQALSFPAVARQLRLADLWPGGSKLPAITQLLRATLELRRGSFCGLVLEIVNTSMVYRGAKRPISRAEIDAVNEAVKRIGFKIPELWDREFLSSLPRDSEPTGRPSNKPDVETLRSLLMSIEKLEPQERGYAFERFLTALFCEHGLSGEGAFKLVGEQIDGSFNLDGNTYLVEARWRGGPARAAWLYEFSAKVERKAHWSRGFFVSYSGYSGDCFEAFERGQQTRIICMDALDLHDTLSGASDFTELLRRKVRRAAETNRAFVPARELF